MHDAHQPGTLDVETCNERACVHLSRLAGCLIQNVLLVATKGRRRARLLEMAKLLLAGVREVDAAAVPTVLRELLEATRQPSKELTKALSKIA